MSILEEIADLLGAKVGDPESFEKQLETLLEEINKNNEQNGSN